MTAHRYRIGCLRAVLLAWWLGAAVGAPTPGASSIPAAWIGAAADGLDARALATLQRIDGTDRQLLALRAYLRAGDGLAARWSWSEEQIAAYPTTPEGRAAAADIDAVSAAFATANPGFTLTVNRMPRSLERQLEHWNTNPSVARTAASLAAALTQQFGVGPQIDANALRQALLQWVPDVAAALAAPGLSAHGQGRAFDFEVLQGDRVVAGLDTASAHRQWDGAGWTDRLRQAVTRSGAHFEGPLSSPYEPWHYAYTPTVSSASAP